MFLYTHRKCRVECAEVPEQCTRFGADSRCSYLQCLQLGGKCRERPPWCLRSPAGLPLRAPERYATFDGLHAACGTSRWWRFTSLRDVRRVGTNRIQDPRPRGTPHPETIPSSLAHLRCVWSRDGNRTGEFSSRSGYLRVGLVSPLCYNVGSLSRVPPVPHLNVISTAIHCSALLSWWRSSATMARRAPE